MESLPNQEVSTESVSVPKTVRETIKECIQCGTCSGVCPAGDTSDFSGPRTLFALILAGQDRVVLESDFIWLCTSCYACTANCPKSIPVTEMIYEIKQAAFDAGLAPPNDKLVRLISSFSHVVGKSGRSNEFTVMRKTIGMNIGEALDSAPLGFKLFQRGRIGLSGERIKAPKEIRKMFSSLADTEQKR